MATFQLGPESPRPFSVLTEGHIRHEIKLPFIPEHERYTFGPTYEARMCEYIHKYLELGTDDKLCYVGEAKGSLVSLLQQEFCLLEPVAEVIPGHIHFEETKNHKLLPMKLSNVGAEDYFKTEAANHPNQFDKILLKDTVNYLDEPKEVYKDVLKTLKDCGRILIIQRPGPMNTLPIFTDAKNRLIEHDQSYLNIIHDLQALGLSVEWEIECLPIVMPKMKWMAMVNERFPPIIEVMSSFEIQAGLRELSEGILKYEGDMVEFQDRLMFISASKPIFTDYPTIQRYGGGGQVYKPPPAVGELRYKMEVTDDIKSYVKEKEKKEARRVSFSMARK